MNDPLARQLNSGEASYILANPSYQFSRDHALPMALACAAGYHGDPGGVSFISPLEASIIPG